MKKIKGGVTENFANEELNNNLNHFVHFYCYKSKQNDLELDFVVEHNDGYQYIIEVKSSKNTHSKSFEKLSNKKRNNQTFILFTYNVSKKFDKYIELPIYLIGYYSKYVIEKSTILI